MLSLRRTSVPLFNQVFYSAINCILGTGAASWISLRAVLFGPLIAPVTPGTTETRQGFIILFDMRRELSIPEIILYAERNLLRISLSLSLAGQRCICMHATCTKCENYKPVL